MVLGIIVAVVGIAGVAVWMYHEGYKAGYEDGAIDGYSVNK